MLMNVYISLQPGENGRNHFK